MITEDPLIKNPLPKTVKAFSSKYDLGTKGRISRINPIKIPTQNPEHLIQVRSLEKIGNFTMK